MHSGSHFDLCFPFSLSPSESYEYSLFTFHSALDPVGSLPSGLYSPLGKRSVGAQQSVAFKRSEEGALTSHEELHGRDGLGETILAPGNGRNGSPRSRKTEKTHQRTAGGLRWVRIWITCREESVVRRQVGEVE